MPEWTLPPLSLHLLMPPGRLRPLRVQALIDHLVRELSNPPWAEPPAPPPSQPARVAQTIEQPHPRRRQRPVERREDEALQEVAGEVEALADVARRRAALAESRKGGRGSSRSRVGLAGGSRLTARPVRGLT